MDFDEHDDPEDEMAEMAVPQGGYDSLTGSRQQRTMGSTQGGGGGDAGPVGVRKPDSVHVRYRECLKNHAVYLGGNAVDGCGEFMASGDEGTLDALRCAACNCHRNFHRKETDGEGGGSSVGNIYYHHHLVAAPQPHHHHNHFSTAYYPAPPPPSGYLHLTPPPPKPLALPAASGGYSREDEDVSNRSSSGGAAAGVFRKRHRTKFTVEQKEKMLALAESLGWRIKKHDEAVVEQLCEEAGVKRHVLKLWMHNNKDNPGDKQPGSSTDHH